MKRMSRAVFAPQSAGGGYAWTWADAQARTAQVVSASDIGKIGYQTDLGRSYECVATLVGQNQDIDLGPNFPGSLLGEGYDIEVYSLDGLSFLYNVTRVNTGHCASGVVSSGYRPDPWSIAHGGWHVSGSQPYVSLVYFARWARGGAPV